MDIQELKKKLRRLKRQELAIRFQYKQYDGTSPLIWNQFFSTKDSDDKVVKYNLNKLVKMNHSDRKEIFNVFFYSVYYQYYKENGLSFNNMYDPSLLASFGLPPDASLENIKERFRILAKIYHPDNGGDPKSFNELMETYDKLKSKY